MGKENVFNQREWDSKDSVVDGKKNVGPAIEKSKGVKRQRLKNYSFGAINQPRDDAEDVALTLLYYFLEPQKRERMTGQCNSVLAKIVLDALETIGKDSEDQMHKKRIQKRKHFLEVQKRGCKC